MAIPATLSSVPSTTPYIQYVATSGQTVFDYPFPITQDSDLIVVANGVTLATDSGYTTANVGTSTGGSITFTSGRTAGDIITLYRDIPIERLTQIAQNSGFNSTAFNAEFNNIYLLLQQLSQDIDQCLQIPNTNNPAPTTTLTGANYAGKYLAFDSNGNPTPAVLTSSGSLTLSILKGLIGYIQSNVLTYNADNTGGTDSTSAFNAAAAATTDYVLVPPGTYKLNSNTNAGLWQVAAGVTFTGSGTLVGQIMEKHGAGSNYTLRVVTNAQTVGQLIPIDFECGFYQTATPNAADQFGQTTECWTPSTSAVVWNGQLTGTYGSFSHFGSGDVNELYGGAFEGFNSGSALATLVVGVSGTANNGGVAAGSPSQTPANSGSATNLRAFTGAVTNSAIGTVSNAVMFYGNSIANTGTGSITTTYGLLLQDQTAGGTNYAIQTGKGIVQFGDAVKVAGRTNLPAATTAAFWLAGPAGGVSNGRIYCGDGTGYQLEFAKRTGSVDTVVGYITDSGSLVLSGGITHGSATLITTTTALTNGAGAGSGTLSNAPANGNPTKWIPIDDNGTTRYIPAW